MVPEEREQHRAFARRVIGSEFDRSVHCGKRGQRIEHDPEHNGK
jgi:hypothetical protein